MNHDDTTIRIWRTPSSTTGATGPCPDRFPDELINAVRAYTDGEMLRIAAAGFNAIWVGSDLFRIVNTEVFPELSSNTTPHLEALNSLINRAKRHKLKVFVFCQLPRALAVDDPFWRNNAHLAGQEEITVNDYGKEEHVRCLCTSMPQVKRYLYQTGEELAGQVPDLGGIILLTASEHPTHCWSRRGQLIKSDEGIAVARSNCPLCSQRKAATVVSEVIRLIRDGIRASSQSMKIIAWNWGWTFYEPSPCRELIAALPRDVILMLDFERDGDKIIAGKKRTVNEYSLSCTAPSNHFIGSLEVAAQFGIEAMAKLQIGTSYELATVPDLPLLPNLFDKAKMFRDLSLSGYMGCWDYGNMLTPNTSAFNTFFQDDTLDDRAQALTDFAHEYFSQCSAKSVVDGWKKFAEAMEYYPFSKSFLYFGPMNFAFILPTRPAPLDGIPLGRSWLLDMRGDDMSAALEDYSIDEVISCLEQLCRVWEEGEYLFLRGTMLCRHRRTIDEMNNVRVCGLSFRSALNFCRIYRLRKSWNDDMISTYQDIIADELGVVKRLLPLLEKDTRFGYHIGAAGYQYDSARIQLRMMELIRQLS